MNKFDTKFYNTAVKMNNALLSLMERKEFKNITISEICKEARVNRTTFYMHYDNIYDLLREIKTDLLKKFLASYDKQIPIENYKTYKASELVFNTPRYLTPFLEFIRNNKAIFKVFINNPNIINLDDLNKLDLKQLLTIVIEKNGITDKRIIDYMTKFFLSGIMTITSEWVKNNCQEDIPFICEVIALCTRQHLLNE